MVKKVGFYRQNNLKRDYWGLSRSQFEFLNMSGKVNCLIIHKITKLLPINVFVFVYDSSVVLWRRWNQYTVPNTLERNAFFSLRRDRSRFGFFIYRSIFLASEMTFLLEIYCLTNFFREYFWWSFLRDFFDELFLNKGVGFWDSLTFKKVCFWP